MKTTCSKAMHPPSAWPAVAALALGGALPSQISREHQLAPLKPDRRGGKKNFKKVEANRRGISPLLNEGEIWGRASPAAEIHQARRCPQD